MSITATILRDDRLDLPVELPDRPAKPQWEAEGQEVDQDGVKDEEQLCRGEEVRRLVVLSGSAMVAIAPAAAVPLARPAKPSSRISQRAQDE